MGTLLMERLALFVLVLGTMLHHSRELDVVELAVLDRGIAEELIDLKN